MVCELSNSERFRPIEPIAMPYVDDQRIKYRNVNDGTIEWFSFDGNDVL